MSDRDPLALGIFMPNCSNMPSISTHDVVEDQWTFDSNQRIALLAESMGFEYLFPVSRWRGFGGETNFLGTSLETTTWAAALLQVTSSIKVFSTVHVPLFHPFVVAKMGATLAHISGGRWGLNIVSGWSQREFSMMGLELPDHAKRYQKTAAFIEILRGLWEPQSEPFHHSSEWYSVEDGVSLPQPPIVPEIANAGTSPDAQAMTARLCDWAFMSIPSVESAEAVVESVRSQAEVLGRSVKTAVFPFLIWRDTLEEAQAELQLIIAAKDDEAANNWLHDISAGSGSFDQFTIDMMAASGGGVHILGTAESVADQLVALYESGVDACMLTFQHYERDLARFSEDILPLLKERGILDS